MIETEGKQISSGKIPVKELFGDDMWYKIPEYQRPYVWDEEQIDNLMDDVSYAALNTPDSQYFLGSLVINTEKIQSKGISYVENIVLDGQQRLTTLYLLHAVIRDLETTSEQRRNTIDGNIYQKGNPDDMIPERTRIEFEVREEVETFIDQYIKEQRGTTKVEELQKLSVTSANISVKNMARAILIIRGWLAENSSDLDQIFPYLRNKVILIYVASAQLDDAFRMFTVLNDRGIKLRNSDILKTLNLQKIDDKDREKRLYYAKKWEELEGDLGEGFDQFLSYIRTILVKEKARNNLLKEFEENIYFEKGSKQGKTPLLEKGAATFELVSKYKEHYDQIFSGNNFHITNNWAFDNLINVLQQTALSDIWIPPLLHYREQFGEYRIYEFLKKLDNKFAGDWISRMTLSLRIEAMNNIIRKIDDSLKAFGSSAEPRVNALFFSNAFAFDEDEFFRYLDCGTLYKKKYARYILRKLDFLLDAPNYTERRNSYFQMSVEHVLPQNPAPDSQWSIDFTTDERNEWTDKMGNLLLLSRKKNSSQGRLDYSLKKDKYFSKCIETFPNSLNMMSRGKWDMYDLTSNHNLKMDLIRKDVSSNR